MARRTAAVLLSALALAAAAAPTALAQSSPFAPLPSSAPQATPTPAPAQTTAEQDAGGRTTLYAILGGLIVVFVAIGVWIARDARGRVPERHRAHAGELREEGPHRHGRQTKAKSRARARQARAARKRNR